MIDAKGTPGYENDCNMTTDEFGDSLTYDAWGHLVSATISQNQPLESYCYDSKGIGNNRTTKF